jgi:hypothetical protein
VVNCIAKSDKLAVRKKEQKAFNLFGLFEMRQPLSFEDSSTVSTSVSRSRRSRSYRACHLTRGSWVQTLPRTVDFKAIKLRSNEFLRRGSEEVGPHTVSFYGMLNFPAEYDRDTSLAKFTDISHQVFPASILGVSAGIC